MKDRELGSQDKGRVRALDHRGVKSQKAPPVQTKNPALRDPTVCTGCGAVYRRKTWRRSAVRSLQALLPGAAFGVCPACTQVRGRRRSFGRVILRGSYLPAHEAEIRRRIMNVVERAGFTQPERRLVSMKRVGAQLEVTTTSQKLAHRLVHELKKAFRGSVSYAWSDRDGGLLATWERDLSSPSG